MTPKNIHKIFIPQKYIYFSETPPPQNIEIQNFEPKNDLSHWGEKGHLFSGSWGALAIILGELGSKHILKNLSFREHCQKKWEFSFQGFGEIQPNSIE